MPRIKVSSHPAPPDGRKGPRTEYTRTLVRLEVGQSFTAPGKLRNSLSVLCSTYGVKLKRVFATRKSGKVCVVLRVA